MDSKKNSFKIENGGNLQWFLEWDMKLTPKQRRAYRRTVKAYIKYLYAMLEDNATQSRRRRRTDNFKGKTAKLVKIAVRAFQRCLRTKTAHSIENTKSGHNYVDLCIVLYQSAAARTDQRR